LFNINLMSIQTIVNSFNTLHLNEKSFTCDICDIVINHLDDPNQVQKLLDKYKPTITGDDEKIYYDWYIVTKDDFLHHFRGYQFISKINPNNALNPWPKEPLGSKKILWKEFQNKFHISEENFKENKFKYKGCIINI